MDKTLHVNKYNKGMTLVELMVVLGIFILVAGLTMFDYSRFRSSVSIQNLADDVALSIRRAQNYAIGVQNTGADFSRGYGAHFTTAGSLPLAGSAKSFVIFNDANSNNKYDYDSSSNCGSATVSVSNECLDLLTITSTDQIADICPGGSCGASDVDIVFTRPDPDARICSGGDCSYSSVDIIVRDIRNEVTKTITVSSVGQISIK